MSSTEHRADLELVGESDTARFVPDPELGLASLLCRMTAAVQRAATQHNLSGMRRAANDLCAIATQHHLHALSRHARTLHGLEFSEADAQIRLYELLDGLELALEHTLARLRLH